MKPVSIATLALATFAVGQTTGKLGNAVITENNPNGVAYMASFPTGDGIQGYITGVSNDNGTGVNFNINLFQFPDASEGPFLYHIHVNPVPSDGNCTATLGHLDPYERGETPVCQASQPETCQVGDLSGKHGTIVVESGSSFQVAYLDLYTSTEEGLGSFFGNRSVVIHSHNLTRLACANFALGPGSSPPVSANGTSATGTSTAAASSSASATMSSSSGSSTTSGSATSPSASTAGGATVNVVNGAALLAGLVAFIL